MIDRSERQMRSYIAEIPDGTYSAARTSSTTTASWTSRSRIALTHHGRGRRDASRLHRHVGATRRARSTSRATPTLSTCLRRAQAHLSRRAGERRHLPAVPLHGSGRQHARGDLPDAGRRATSSRSGASSTSSSGRWRRRSPTGRPAAFFGTTGVATVSGTHPRTSAYFVGVFPYPGGYGALARERRPRQRQPAAVDGELHVARAVGAPLPDPLRAFRAPRGFRRRGLASRRLRHDLRDLQPAPTASSRCSATARRRSPFGVAGGGPAAPNSVEFTHRQPAPGRRSSAASRRSRSLRDGDRIRVASPGGGGFGDPLTRDLEAVEQDLNFGYISREHGRARLWRRRRRG